MKTPTTAAVAILCLALYCTAVLGQGISFASDPRYKTIKSKSSTRDVDLRGLPDVENGFIERSSVLERDMEEDEEDEEKEGESESWDERISTLTTGQHLEKRKKPCKKGYKLNKKGKCKKSGALNAVVARPRVALLVALAILVVAQL